MSALKGTVLFETHSCQNREIAMDGQDIRLTEVAVERVEQGFPVQGDPDC